MCNRIVDMLCMAVASNSGFAKIYFVKFLISPICKNKVKYKFPGIRYNIIIVTNALFFFIKRHKPVSHYYLIEYGNLLLCRAKILLGLNFAIFSKSQFREKSRLGHDKGPPLF